MLRFLSSRKLAIWLLGIAFGVSFSEQLYLYFATGKEFTTGKIISSPYFIVFLVILLLNTCACTLRRLSQQLRGKSGNSEGVKGLKLFSEQNMVGGHFMDNQRKVTKYLKDKRYSLSIDDYSTSGRWVVRASKGKISTWASLIFHFSLIGIGIGIIISFLFGYHAVFNITEGQILKVANGTVKVNEGKLSGGKDPGFDLGVAEFKIEYGKGLSEPTKMASYVRVFNKHEIILSTPVFPNNTAEYNGYQIMLSRYGLAPHINLKDKNGQQVFDGYINLDWMMHKPPIFDVRDSITIPNTGINMDLQLFPDAKINEDGTVTSISNEPKLPLLELTARDNSGELFKGKALPGQLVNLSNGMTLMFDDVLYWNGFEVSKDPGVPVIFFFFVLGWIGLAFAVILAEKRIIVQFENGIIKIYGKSSRFQGLFEEEVLALAATLNVLTDGGQVNGQV